MHRCRIRRRGSSASSLTLSSLRKHKHPQLFWWKLDEQSTQVWVLVCPKEESTCCLEPPSRITGCWTFSLHNASTVSQHETALSSIQKPKSTVSSNLLTKCLLTDGHRIQVNISHRCTNVRLPLPFPTCVSLEHGAHCATTASYLYKMSATINPLDSRLLAALYGIMSPNTVLWPFGL